MRVDHADDREDQEPLAYLQHGRRELSNGFLLLPNHALALLHEPDRDGDGDTVRRGLVGVEHPIENGEIASILGEEGPGQDVAQEEHDADHLVRLDAARNDALGQVPGV